MDSTLRQNHLRARRGRKDASASPRPHNADAKPTETVHINRRLFRDSLAMWLGAQAPEHHFISFCTLNIWDLITHARARTHTGLIKYASKYFLSCHWLDEDSRVTEHTRPTNIFRCIYCLHNIYIYSGLPVFVSWVSLKKATVPERQHEVRVSVVWGV